MSETTDAPQSNARSTDRPSHCACSLAGTNGGADEHEDAQRDVAAAELAGGAAELVERHPLVEPLERVGMRRLEPHRHFQPRRAAGGFGSERVEQLVDARPDQRGMRLDDDPREPGHRRRDRAVVGRRHRARVEETAGVVQLDVRSHASC